jgi:hypothetical protein
MGRDGRVFCRLLSWTCACFVKYREQSVASIRKPPLGPYFINKFFGGFEWPEGQILKCLAIVCVLEQGLTVKQGL